MERLLCSMHLTPKFRMNRSDCLSKGFFSPLIQQRPMSSLTLMYYLPYKTFSQKSSMTKSHWHQSRYLPPATAMNTISWQRAGQGRTSSLSATGAEQAACRRYGSRARSSTKHKQGESATEEWQAAFGPPSVCVAVRPRGCRVQGQESNAKPTGVTQHQHERFRELYSLK